MPPRDGNDVGCYKIPAARRKGMSPLHSLLAAAAIQCLHLVDQAGNEKFEALFLLAQQKLIANLIALCGKVRIAGLLVLEHRKNNGVCATADRTADFARLHGEGYRGLS